MTKREVLEKLVDLRSGRDVLNERDKEINQALSELDKIEKERELTEKEIEVALEEVADKYLKELMSNILKQLESEGGDENNTISRKNH